MKKYLRYIENTGYILMIIGWIAYRFMHYYWAVWGCVLGLALFLLQVIYKSFNWKMYAEDNKQNIIKILVAIVILFIKMLTIR